MRAPGTLSHGIARIHRNLTPTRYVLYDQSRRSLRPGRQSLDRDHDLLSSLPERPGNIRSPVSNETEAFIVEVLAFFDAHAGLRPRGLTISVDRQAVVGVAVLREQLGKTTGRPVLLEINRGGSAYFLAVPLS